MAKLGRVLVTRPAPDNQSLCDQLATAGWSPMPLPLFEIAAFDEPTAQAAQVRNQIMNLDLYCAVIVVSKHAARIGGDWIDQYWPQLPIGIEWLAIGKATANVLAGYDIHAGTSELGIDSEALLNHPALSAEKIAHQRILIMRGDSGRDLLADTLRQRGAQVDYCDLYHRQAVTYPIEEIKNGVLQAPLSGILINNGEALLHLCSLVGRSITLTETTLVVPSQRIAQLAREQGFRNIHVAGGADNNAMINALNAADRKEE